MTELDRRIDHNPENRHAELGINPQTYQVWVHSINRDVLGKRKQHEWHPEMTLPRLFQEYTRYPEAERDAHMNDFLTKQGIAPTQNMARHDIISLLHYCANKPPAAAGKAPTLYADDTSPRRIKMKGNYQVPTNQGRFLPIFFFMDSEDLKVAHVSGHVVLLAYYGTDKEYFEVIKEQAAFLNELYGYDIHFDNVKKKDEERFDTLYQAGRVQLRNWFDAHQISPSHMLSADNMWDIVRKQMHPTSAQDAASMLENMNNLLVLFAGGASQFHDGHPTKKVQLDKLILHQFGEKSPDPSHEPKLVSIKNAHVLKNRVLGEILQKIKIHSREIRARYGDIFSPEQSDFLKQYEEYLKSTQFTFAEVAGEIRLVEASVSS